jgi:3-deoxy-manno-octulosonate cytidylyltransferase (CMP-KDO synthetase)
MYGSAAGAPHGIDEVIIATDEMRIAEAAFDFGAEVALTSAKHQSGTDRIAEVAKRLRGVACDQRARRRTGDRPRADQPPRPHNARRFCIGDDHRSEQIRPDEDVANPNAVKVVLDRTGHALYFSRSAIPFVRGDGERPMFYRHQGIYGYTRPFLLQFVRWKSGILEKAEQLEQLRAWRSAKEPVRDHHEDVGWRRFSR